MNEAEIILLIVAQKVSCGEKKEETERNQESGRFVKHERSSKILN